jgi:BirA family biotin operon repressor/biotin-[acetyl-CoA-carboxylase] ligase
LQSNDFSGIFIGENRINLERVASTNDYLKAELSKSKPFPEGTVIMAVEQFAGRGQVGTRWESQKGKNLTVSILLCPSFLHPSKQFNLNIAICLAIQHVLSTILPEKVFIKWPNDIYVGNKKLGGILIENIIQGNTWKYAIIGIGINVNQCEFPENARNAGSLIKLLHESYSIEKLLTEICRSIEQHYFQLKMGGHAKQKELYCENLFGINETRPFKIDGIQVEGKIVAVDESGQLLIDFNGHVTKFGFKEIEYVI